MSEFVVQAEALVQSLSSKEAVEIDLTLVDEKVNLNSTNSDSSVSCSSDATHEVVEEEEGVGQDFIGAAQNGTRCSIASSSSEEGPAVSLNTVEEGEEEKQATDSGYESDRRKSFSSSSVAENVPTVNSVNEEVRPLYSIDEKASKREAQLRECRAAQSGYSLPLYPPMLPIHPVVQHPVAIHHHHRQIITCNQLIHPHAPQPAMYFKQAEAAAQKPYTESWEQYVKILSVQSMNQSKFVNSLRPSTLPPVVLPLPVCCKASPAGPKETRKFAIPKYAIGFVIGHNGTRIQATRDVSGATILLLGDKDSHHAVIGVFGSQGQIHDAIYLMKQNILRHSGMFIGDIDGMLKPIQPERPTFTS